MNIIKKGGLIFIAVLLLSVSTYAASFDAEFEAVDNSITFGGLAHFKLIVTNNLRTSEEFKVKNLDYPIWDITTEPLLNPIQFTVMPGKKKEVDIFLNPLYISNYGVYDVNVVVELVSKKVKVKKPLRVSIISLQVGTYVETVLASISMDDEIDPTKEIPIRITLNNQNIIEYPDILVEIESKLIKDKVKESLEKKEKKTITLTKSIDPQTLPQEDTLIVRLISNNKTLDTKVKRISIIEHKELEKEEKIKERFLKTEKEIILRNVGNVRFQDRVKVESSLIQNFFTSSKPKGTFIKEDGKRYLLVPVDIPVGESSSIIVTRNYITLPIIVILLVVIMIFYYIFRSPLAIKKTAANISFKEGGISELKVVLNVRNRSKDKLKEIEIIDKIPNIADLERGLTIGTLHPTKVLKHDRKGTMIKWLIDEIGPKDERVISYKIKSHLSILGEFSLTQASAKFRFKGKEIITHSNTLGVSP